jgi:signal transduction histidine kinase
MVATSAHKISELETELSETYRSVTELSNDLFQTNELLRVSNKKLSELYNTAHQFVDNVSHEFRTPLSVIKEFSAILRDGLGGEINDEQREYLEIVINRVEDLNIMVNDMLDISRLEAGLLGVVREECSAVDIVEHIKTTLEHRAVLNSINLTIDIGPQLPTVYCDADKIRQVIINLVVNACKFSSEGGDVELKAYYDLDQSQIVFSVTDNGPGLSAENAQAIFERFRQVGDNIRASTKGFGLGLSIAKELVHLNLGDIGVESEPGKGSSFFFTVPIFDPPRILERFMKRAELFRNSPAYISVVTARIDPEVGSDRQTDIEQFLQRQLRHTDLLLRAVSDTWFIFAATNLKGIDQMIARLENAWIESNRNRLGGDLPEIRFKSNGTWRILDQRGELVEKFVSAFNPDELRRGKSPPTEPESQGNAA